MSKPTPATSATPLTSTDADPGGRELEARIATFARRRARVRDRRGRSLWAQATWVGTLGWLVAVPIVLGAILGHLLDRRLGTGITWAMAFIGVGVLIGGYALWRLGYDVHAQDDRERREDDAGDEPS
jgi:ATP synthase protein I